MPEPQISDTSLYAGHALNAINTAIVLGDRQTDALPGMIDHASRLSAQILQTPVADTVKVGAKGILQIADAESTPIGAVSKKGLALSTTAPSTGEVAPSSNSSLGPTRHDPKAHGPSGPKHRM